MRGPEMPRPRLVRVPASRGNVAPILLDVSPPVENADQGSSVTTRGLAAVVPMWHAVEHAAVEGLFATIRNAVILFVMVRPVVLMGVEAAAARAKQTRFAMLMVPAKWYHVEVTPALCFP